MYHIFELVITAVLSSAATVFTLRYLNKNKGTVSHTNEQDNDSVDDPKLDKLLERARKYPGAETMLYELARQPKVTRLDMWRLSTKLDDLERAARIENARQFLAHERRAPLVRKYAALGMAHLEKVRQQRLQQTGTNE